MPRREWRLRIGDIIQAVGRIQRYTASLTFDTFNTDELRVDAVVRNLAIIGEAARHIPADIQKRYPDVPWSDMRGIRNVVTHEYFGIVLDVIWETAQTDLPPLVSKLQEILDREGR